MNDNKLQHTFLRKLEKLSNIYLISILLHILLLLLLLRSNPQHATTQKYYIAGWSEEKRQEQEITAQLSLSIPSKEMGGSHPGWNHRTKGIDHLKQRKTQGASIVKGWEDKREHKHLPDTFTLNKNNTSAGPLTP